MALSGCAAFFVLYPFWFSWYLLVLLLLLIPFDLLASAPGMLTGRIALSAPHVLEQGASGLLVVTTIRKKRFPANCIKAFLRVSGEDHAFMRRIICDATHGSRYEIDIDTSYSGMTIFEFKRFWPVSLLGIFSIPAPQKSRVSVLILPAPSRPPHIAALPRGVILRPKPGGGFSEEHDLRHYRHGDPVRSIHWKLSAKLDSLIIREPLVPPKHSRLVHASWWDGAAERDLILGRLRWICDYLLKWELPFYIKLGDDPFVPEIAKPQDLVDFLYNILSGPPYGSPQPVSLPSRFDWVFRVDARGGAR